jgi:hypothetical protein
VFLFVSVSFNQKYRFHWSTKNEQLLSFI